MTFNSHRQCFTFSFMTTRDGSTQPYLLSCNVGMVGLLQVSIGAANLDPCRSHRHSKDLVVIQADEGKRVKSFPPLLLLVLALLLLLLAFIRARCRVGFRRRGVRDDQCTALPTATARQHRRRSGPDFEAAWNEMTQQRGEQALSSYELTEFIPHSECATRLLVKTGTLNEWRHGDSNRRSHCQIQLNSVS